MKGNDTNRWLMAALLALSLFCAAPARALEVRVHPAGFVYSYEVEAQHGLYSAMVHNIAVLNSGPSVFTLESVELQALHAGRPVLTLTVNPDDLDNAAKKIAAMSAQGILKLYDFHLQISRYLPDNVAFAASRTMEPGSAILITSKPLLISATVDEIAVTARGTAADGKPAQARTVLKVRQYKSPNDYHAPVAGTWYIGAAPSLESHHRWAANQEFAIDFGMLGPNSRTHAGAGARLADYSDYGKDVLAAADGVVVEAHDGAPESDSNLQQPGESADAYMQRTMAQQNELLMKGYLEPLGNYVVIKHEGGEYSDYAHLRTGTVKVKKGDAVKRGQVVGQLGHSGNSTEPHLHFQVTDGPDPMYSRGIPVVFSNVFVEMLGYENAPLQSGWIITTQP